MTAIISSRSATAWLRIGALALAVASLSLSGCGGKDAGETPRRTARRSSSARTASRCPRSRRCRWKSPRQRRHPISASYSGTANLEAPGEAQVVAKTSGVMVQLLAEEGDQVTAGQVLARMDGDRVRLEAQQQLTQVRKLENNFRRSQELAAQKLVSAEASDQIRYDLESARASYELAKLELSYTNITAPISGVIAQRMVKPGNLISAQCADVPHRQQLAPRGRPERARARTRPAQGRPAGAHDRGRRAGPDVRRQGRSRQPGRGLRQRHLPRGLRVRQRRPRCSRACSAGSRSIYDQRQDALIVPRIALLDDEGEPARVRGSRQQGASRAGETRLHQWRVAEVRRGVKEGDMVVTAGKIALRDGTDVQVISACRDRPPPRAVAIETAGAQ